MSCLFGRNNCSWLLSLALAATAQGSVDSIGEIGINSVNLPYTGQGISIGQVELIRPGKPGFDDGSHSNFFTTPKEVYLLDGRVNPTPNAMNELFQGTPPEPHATWVAGVMISKDAFAPGVARDADLYASHGQFFTNPFVIDSLEVTSQFIATRDNDQNTNDGGEGEVRAINMSFLVPFDPGEQATGDSKLTQFIDWSARVHDVLYVTGIRNNFANTPMVYQPSDEFNGITAVASTKAIDGTYRQVAPFADFSGDAEGDRVSVDIMAPGKNIEVAALGGGQPPVVDGSSFAAPHVTGTVALLEEHAEKQIMNVGGPRWTANARRHEVMKAVLMNSADKLIDNGTVQVNGTNVPQGGLLGMSRTALDQNGFDWLQSEAYDDSFEGGGRFTPLDDQMGAGHLNATRALQQFIPGEYAADSGDVPTIGWDYGHTTPGSFNKAIYPLAGNLLANHFISITLAWDRYVTFQNEGATAGVFEDGDTFNDSTAVFPAPYSDDLINDLDIFLLPKGSTDISQAVAEATSGEGTLEHLFFQIPTTDEYEIWVRQFDQEPSLPTGQDYALAWWYGVAPPLPIAGDYNGDQVVDAQDYGVWRGGFGSTVTPGTGADGNGNGTIDSADYVIWRNRLASGVGATIAVPEPHMWVLPCIGFIIMASKRRSNY